LVIAGGSTGVPLRFYRDRSVLDAASAGTFPQPAAGRLGARGHDRLLLGLEQSVRKRCHLMSLNCVNACDVHTNLIHFSRAPRTWDLWLDKFAALKPKVVFGYASTVARFAAHAENSKRRLPTGKGSVYKPRKGFTPSSAKPSPGYSAARYMTATAVQK